MVQAAVITGYGINADEELAQAFHLSGAAVHRIHVNDLIEQPNILESMHILGFPGGFSFGDHLGSGLVFAHVCKKHLKEDLEHFVREGKLVIGICNGFQVLVKMGMLPDFSGDWTQEVSLIHNSSGVFEDSWVRVSFNPESRCVWTKDLPSMELPIRHGEGRFYAPAHILDRMVEEQSIVLTYSGRNPNGSLLDIAGITDATGRVLGLMPHPEAFLIPENHPSWTREPPESAEGLTIFQNGVDHITKKLLLEST